MVVGTENTELFIIDASNARRGESMKDEKHQTLGSVTYINKRASFLKSGLRKMLRYN